jgi:deoxyribonuclease V
MKDTVLEHELLQDHYTIEQAEALQITWLKEAEKEKLETINIANIKFIAGVDISFPKSNDPKWGIACAVLWDYQTNKIITHEFVKGVLNFSYTPGFLGFRENKLIAQAILNLPKKPDVIMCDGHGNIHPRRFGEAMHLGLALKIPSFGVAKNPFIGNSDWKLLSRTKGEKTPVWISKVENEPQSDREILGTAICVTDNFKPVFVSIGYRMSLEIALKLALDTSINHRQPEPIFHADNLSRKELKKLVIK